MKYITELNHKEVLKVYSEEQSLRRTAKLFNCSTPTISKILDEHNIDKSFIPKQTTKQRQEQSNLMKQMHQQGKFKGEKHSQWKGGILEVHCTYCSKLVKRRATELKKRKTVLCGDICRKQFCAETVALLPKPVGSNHHGWKGDELIHTCLTCGNKFRKAWGNSLNKYCSSKCWGKSNRGSNHKYWKGGVNSLYQVIRNCTKTKEWRQAVFAKDNYTCKHCGDSKGGNLNAHHLIRFNVIFVANNVTTLEEAEQCEALWDINNGITLCVDCHKEVHKK